MRFVLIGVGSMGDVLPQMTLASELVSRGHRAVVIGLMPYAPLAASLGVEYAAVPAGTSALCPDDALRRGMALAQRGIMYATMLHRFRQSAPVTNEILVQVAQPGDVIITGLVTAGASRLLGRELGAQTIPVMYAPLLPADSARVARWRQPWEEATSRWRAPPSCGDSVNVWPPHTPQTWRVAWELTQYASFMGTRS